MNSAKRIQLRNAISGAIRDFEHAHGPCIPNSLQGSLAKRCVGAVVSVLENSNGNGNEREKDQSGETGEESIEVEERDGDCGQECKAISCRHRKKEAKFREAQDAYYRLTVEGGPMQDY